MDLLTCVVIVVVSIVTISMFIFGAREAYIDLTDDRLFYLESVLNKIGIIACMIASGTIAAMGVLLVLFGTYVAASSILELMMIT